MVEKLMERDYFLDANQALEMGLVDKVLTSREEQAEAMAPLAGVKGDKSDKKDGGSDDKGDGGGGGDGQSQNPATNPSPS
jgi:hypothetical protein